MSTGASDVILEASGVSRSFRGLQALADYNLRLQTGEILGVIGPNGAGKTTLFNVITGFLPPTSGTIRLRDQDISGKEPDQIAALGIARTFQNIRLFARMTVLDNVKTAQQLHGKAGFWETIFSTPSFLNKERALEERAYAHLESLGLARFANVYAAALPYGFQRKLEIARALATEPKVLLCDEATSALDPETTEDILTLLDQLNRELGLTIVLITHQMEVVRRVCDRVAVMKDGRVVEQGATADVFLHPTHETTRAMLAEGEEAFDASLAPVGGRLAKLTFRGGSTYEPELSRVARSVGVDYSILSGRISRIRGEPYGQLVVAFTGGDAEAAVGQLTERGVRVEAA